MGIKIANNTKEGHEHQSDPSAIKDTNDINSQTRVRLERSLRSNNVIDQIHDAVIATDLNGTIIAWNKGAERQLGYTSDEILAHSIYNLYPEERHEYLTSDVLDILQVKGIFEIEVTMRRKSGEIFFVHSSLSPLTDETGEVIGIISYSMDISARKNSEKLSFQATHDVLTGLVNRGEFENRLKRILHTILEQDSEHALLYLDLDQFKVINDTCGHIAGDELLRQLGSLLSKGIRKRDTVARLGGDEFGVLMEHCSLKQAKRVANKLKRIIDQFRFLWEEKQFNIGVSIGLVVIDKTSGNFIDLLKRADAACYAAKEQGRNRIHIYQVDDEHLAKQHGEMQWVSIIHQALEKDMFFLAFQNVIPIKKTLKQKNNRNRYELLLRMQLDNDVIKPNKFLPAAESYNIAIKIDQWVINTAFSHFGKNKELSDATDEIFINLSGQSISDVTFLDFINKAFIKYKISQDKICFEITESATIANLTKAKVFIDALKKGGCKFALDDFGSGLSSFAYLKTLHVDYLKIDSFYVKDIGEDPIDYAIVKSINDIGHEMGLEIIAEFVENKKILDKLKRIGVDFAQGYHFGEIQTLIETI